MGTISSTKPDLERGQLTRRLGAFEHLIWLTDQWTPRHFILVARIEGGSIAEDDLRAAFLQAQRRHPALRVSINVGPDGWPRFVPAHSTIHIRVVERHTTVQWQREVEAELLRRFDTAAGPLLRATLVRDGSIAELILAAHHSIGDGISAINLLRDLLESLEGGRLQELPPRPSLEELAGNQTAELVGQPPSLDVPVKLERPGAPKIESIEIESGELERILSRCREERTTIQGALLAAILLSLPGPAFRCLAPVNIRQLTPPVGEDFGLYISSGTASLDPDATRDFWSAARTARDQLARALNPEALRARAAGMASLVARNPNPRSAYEIYRSRVNYGAVLSNLGRLMAMPTVRQFRITALYPVLNVELEPLIGVATADGRMSITTVSEGSADLSWIRLALSLLRS